jgi:hypothetical protein
MGHGISINKIDNGHWCSLLPCTISYMWKWVLIKHWGYVVPYTLTRTSYMLCLHDLELQNLPMGIIVRRRKVLEVCIIVYYQDPKTFKLSLQCCWWKPTRKSFCRSGGRDGWSSSKKYDCRDFNWQLSWQHITISIQWHSNNSMNRHREASLCVMWKSIAILNPRYCIADSITCVTSWSKILRANYTLEQSVFMRDKGKAIRVTGRGGP